MMLVKTVMKTVFVMGTESQSRVTKPVHLTGSSRSKSNITGTVFRTILFLCLWISSFTTLDAQEAPLLYELLEEQVADTYVGDVAVDAKLNSKYNSTEMAKLRFSFLTQPKLNREYFYIQETSGVIRTTGRIDRDVICPAQPSCVLKFDVAVRPVKFFQIIKVTISIKDINDNPPVFPRRHVLHQMSESAVPGTSFSVPAATDPDSSVFSVKSYRLNSRSNKFDLRVRETADGTTDLRIVLNGELDRENMEYYQCEIVAEDGGKPPKSGTVLIDIEILDANDNDPIFENSTYEVHVFENTPLYTTIIRVKAKDPDESANGDVMYQFSKHTQQSFGHLFAIDSTTGEIYVYGELDYEQGDIYLLSVTANDRGPDSLPAHTTVVVRVEDINDNAPTITVNTLTANGDAHVSENAPPGTFVAHISVADADSGPNGKFSCAVDNGNFQLQKLYQTEYKIVTAHSFDRELHPYFDLTLQCTDKGSQPQTSYAHIRVTVMDENDHTPQFTQYFYTATIIENNHRDDFVIEVTANDRDADQNGQVYYKLADNAKNLVAIEEETGIITANVIFDHEEVHELEFNVIAMDGGATPRSSTATVVLTVMDVDDEKPKFMQDKYAFGVAENQPPNTEVGQVVAVDRDSEPYNMFTYSIFAEEPMQDVFKIDPHEGKIRTKQRLDREAEPVYFLVVIAQSSDLMDSSSASVSIYVADKNDNAPGFDFPTPRNNSLTVSYDTPPGHVFTQLKAHDRDTGKNGKLNFFIEGGNTNDVFAVDLDTGAVSVNKGLSRYVNEKFSLRVTATDQGEPRQSSVAELNIAIGGGAAFQRSRGVRISTNNLIIIVIFIVATVILAIITVVVVIIIRKRDRDQPPAPGSPKETEKMLPARSAPPSSTPSHSQYGTSTQNPIPNGSRYVMTTTLSGAGSGNDATAHAQKRQQRAVNLLDGEERAVGPSRGKRSAEAESPSAATTALLSQVRVIIFVHTETRSSVGSSNLTRGKSTHSQKAKTLPRDPQLLASRELKTCSTHCFICPMRKFNVLIVTSRTPQSWR